MKAAMESIRSGGRAGDFFRDMTVLLHRTIVNTRLLEKPVVATVNGAGISLDAACACAWQQGALGSIRATPPSAWGPVLEPQQALAVGLANEVVPDQILAQPSREVAASLAQGAYRRIIVRSGTADFVGGMTAFLEKRPSRCRRE
jgi:enoyl-CoA hydratase/carnithine racemase